MITFLILKSDIIENSRIELRGIVEPVPSNQIKVTFIIILPFNLVLLWFFPVSHGNWRKRWVDYLGGGGEGGGKGYVGPPLKLLGGLPPPPLPTPMSYTKFAFIMYHYRIKPEIEICVHVENVLFNVVCLDGCFLKMNSPSRHMT